MGEVGVTMEQTSLLRAPLKKELKYSLKEIITNTDLSERLSNNQNLIPSMEGNYLLGEVCREHNSKHF